MDDLISRHHVEIKLKELVNEMEEIFSNIREKNVDDSVCGLCEYDCDHGLDGFANECPGFEKDDCFKLNEKYRSEWISTKELPSAQPERIQNNVVHLCDSCQYTYATCPSHGNDAVFGDGKGNDNICACNKYLPISAQPERKKGRWIPVTQIYRVTEGHFPKTHIEWVDATEPDNIDGVRCSECSTVYDFAEARNWCSECGADMRGEEA